MILTRINRVEGEHIDQLTTTTAQVVESLCGRSPAQGIDSPSRYTTILGRHKRKESLISKYKLNHLNVVSMSSAIFQPYLSHQIA